MIAVESEPEFEVVEQLMAPSLSVPPSLNNTIQTRKGTADVAPNVEPDEMVSVRFAVDSTAAVVPVPAVTFRNVNCALLVLDRAVPS